METSKHLPKECDRCGRLFDCRAGSYTLCHCFGLNLSREELAYLSDKYEDCLCADCLQHEKQLYNDMNDLDLNQRIEASETRIFKVVFPNTTNNYDTLFGGNAMQLMDEVAFITATRFSRKKVVTVSSSQIDFKKPIPENTIIELIGRVVRVGNTSLDIDVQIFKEEMYENRREQAIQGRFTFVAIDEQKRPTSVL